MNLTFMALAMALKDFDEGFYFDAIMVLMANLWPSVVQMAAAQPPSFWQALSFKAVPPSSFAHLEKTSQDSKSGESITSPGEKTLL